MKTTTSPGRAGRASSAPSPTAHLRCACGLLTILVLLLPADSGLAQSYPSAVWALNPLVYFRLNQTTQPPAQLQANNLGTLGAQGNGFYFGGTTGQRGALVANADTAARFNGGV